MESEGMNMDNVIKQNEPLKVPDGAFVLPDGKMVSMNERITMLNNNVIVCGTSGSLKTRNFIIPNLLEGVGSYIITDPKGNLYNKYAGYLQKGKLYTVKRMSFINPEQSIHYNPLAYIKTTLDIQKLVYNLIFSNKEDKIVPDPYWNNQSVFLMNSIFAYLYESKEDNPNNNNIPTAINLLRVCGRTDANTKSCKYLEIIKRHKEKYPDSWAYEQYMNVYTAPNKTYDTVVSNCLSKFSIYDTKEIRSMLSSNDLVFSDIGRQKCALFIEISDTDKSMQPLINTLFTQAFNELCLYADSREDSRLPVPTRFFLDDFPSMKIPDFDIKSANIRSRKISVTIVIQSPSQLAGIYGENSANTIIDNCDTLIFTGTNSPETAKAIGLRANKTPDTILHMPLGHSWIFRRGQIPYMCKNFNLDEWIEDNHRLFNVYKKI
jgi:type IV secretion system protein VirD4